MKIPDSLPGLLYLGEVSRQAIGYGKTRGDQDHTWSTFKNMRDRFLAKHPSMTDGLNEFMTIQSKMWGNLFNELFKLNSLALFVSINLTTLHNENRTGTL